ncbi:MAG: hypothetical protein PHE83_17680 [Opitutaceae bacterium]|nr:hypothetical protein [Opitutaceae bacterium]
MSWEPASTPAGEALPPQAAESQFARGGHRALQVGEGMLTIFRSVAALLIVGFFRLVWFEVYRLTGVGRPSPRFEIGDRFAPSSGCEPVE